MRSGFTLIELAIVLVILGLLAGGVMEGQSLIRQAELRSVISEEQKYVASVHTFRDKYFALPGDMSNATQFWGRLNSNADCVTNSSAAVASPGTCDGNGDGVVPWYNGGATGTGQEMHQFWRQLDLAGLIEGNYTGLAGPTLNSADVVPGTNSPVSKLTNAGWGAAGGGICGTGDCFYYGTSNMSSKYHAYLAFGQRASSGGNLPINAALKPEEAWNIDKKLDDGMPATGGVIARFAGANYCTTSASVTDYTGTYNLSSSSIYCALYFINAF